MKFQHKLISFLVVLFMAVVLSGCGTSLQKPTGLEDDEMNEVENTDPAEKTESDVEEFEIGGKGSVDHEELTEETVSEEQERNEKDEGTSNLGDLAKKPIVSEEEKKTEPDGKSGGMPSEVLPTKPSANPLGKPNGKPSDKTDGKPAEKSVNKPAEKPVEKPVVKPESKPESKPDPAPAKPVAPSSSKITQSIVISSSEVPLAPTEMDIKDGDTVLDALITITKKHKIQMDYRGGRGATAYIEGIANVYEFDRGQGSGWMYRVNGIFPDRGAGVVPLQDGDRVEWLYTTNLGGDLNANLQPFRR